MSAFRDHRGLCMALLAIIGFFHGISAANGDDIPVAVQRYFQRVDMAFSAVAERSAIYRQTCKDFVGSAMDINAIAEVVAGAMTTKPSEAQTVRLKAVLKSRFQHECEELRGDFGNRALHILGGRQKGGLWIVTTRTSSSNGKDRTIVWKLKSGGSWGMRAEDMSVDGRGVIATLLAEINNRLPDGNGNIDEAIGFLAR